MISKEYYTKKGPHDVTIKAPIGVGICKIKGGFMVTINGEPVDQIIRSFNNTDSYSKAVKAQRLVCNVLHELGLQQVTYGLTIKESKKGAPEYYSLENKIK